MPLRFAHTRNSRFTNLILKTRSPTCQSRPFHASRPHRLVDEVLLVSHAAFKGLHESSGLSWAPSIFLAGILFRVLFLPLEIAYQRNRKRWQTFQPLIYAWRHELLRQARIRGQKGLILDGPLAAEIWVERRMYERRNLLSGKYKYHPWVGLLPLASAPAWLINTDVVRRMVGMKQSLISYFFQGGDIDPSLIPPDPAMASESFLWIPSLAVADPYWVLPITLWGLAVLQIHLRLKDLPLMTLRQIQSLPTFQTRMLAGLSSRLREAGVMLGLVLGPILILLKVPSALVLYWIAASGTLIVERLLVKRIVGVGKTYKPAAPLSARMKKKS